MDDIAQRMLARRKGNLDSSIVVGLLLAAAVSVLPMCDACHEAAVANAFADVGFSSSGPSALWPCLLWLGIGTAIVFVVRKLVARRAEGTALVLLGIVVAGWMVYRSSARIARTRSNAVDSWEQCFHSTTVYGAESYGPTMGPNDRSSFGGPHQGFSGEPCVEESEHRTDHRREHPEGDLLDGIHQVSYRFLGDRARVIYLPVVLLLGLVVAFVLVIAAARRRAPPPSPGPAEPEG
jgi:hypothetical protein